MKKRWLIIAGIVIVIILIIGLIGLRKAKPPKEENSNFKIVTTFYPMYIMTSNIAQGAQNIELVNMTDINTGCVHDYTLSTTDMKKIEGANVLIENGFGLENFIDKILSTHSDIKLINSGKNIMNTIQENGNTNPHIWTSLSNYILQVEEITNELKLLNPENAEIYQNNSERYIQNIKQIQIKYETQLSNLNGKKAICLNEALNYIARDIGLEITSVVTNHEESSLSAEAIKNLIDKMKAENIKIILVGNEDNLKNAEILSSETGARIFELSSGLTGSREKDSYLNGMNSNFYTLRAIEVE